MWLSPHYFFRKPEHSRLSKSEFLETEYARNFESRGMIVKQLLADHLRPDLICLDYGCGPGFLAINAAPEVQKVIACDISAGVLACAEAINHAPNIEYRTITKGRIPAEDSSIDLIYSFAVFQHVTDDVMLAILREFKRVMKPSASAVCNVIVEGVGWRSEAEWRADKSLKGRVKWELGLHCFLHPRERIQEMAESAGLRVHGFNKIAELGANLAGDNIEREQLCILTQKLRGTRPPIFA